MFSVDSRFQYSMCGAASCSPWLPTSFRRKFNHAEELCVWDLDLFLVVFLWREGRTHRKSTCHVIQGPLVLLAESQKGAVWSALGGNRLRYSTLILGLPKAPMLAVLHRHEFFSSLPLCDIDCTIWQQLEPTARSIPSWKKALFIKLVVISFNSRTQS